MNGSVVFPSCHTSSSLSSPRQRLSCGQGDRTVWDLGRGISSPAEVALVTAYMHFHRHPRSCKNVWTLEVTLSLHHSLQTLSSSSGTSGGLFFLLLTEHFLFRLALTFGFI